MTIQENNRIARRASEETFSNPRPELFDELYSRDVQFHFGSQTIGFDQGKQNMLDRRMQAAFPDFQVTVEEVIAEGDLVVVRERARGTHQGEYQTPMGPIAPTGKQIELTGTVTRRIQNGKIVESWVNRDVLALLQQIGAIPASAQAAVPPTPA